ncbi:MAG TPA: hypothetical protein VK432_00155 [Stellaceae bacterium]|nr:hypothetical protein [Stellaceae bacterium]
MRLQRRAFVFVIAMCSTLVTFGAHVRAQTMSVEDYVLDSAKLRGKTIAVSGKALCINELCYLYGESFNSNVLFKSEALPRDARKKLLSCDMFLNTCSVVITGRVSGDMMNSLIATDISFSN